MAVHPQIAVALQALSRAELPSFETLTPEEARAQMDAMTRARGGEAEAIDRTEDRAIPGPAGDIPVRIYWPLAGDGDAAKPCGAVLYLHGGGHVIGSLESHDRVARNTTANANVIVVSVDYRMGPEHKFPAAVDDTFAALQWLAGAAPGLGAPTGKLAVAGDSAGANLAAVAALMARDAGGPVLSLQVLVYPIVDYGLTSPSYERYGTGYGILSTGAMTWFQQHYLNGDDDIADWRASPIKAASLAGLAPAMVLTAECDVLHDEGAAYAKALSAANVVTEYRDYAGMIHGFFGMAPDIDAAVEAHGDVGKALKRAFA